KMRERIQNFDKMQGFEQSYRKSGKRYIAGVDEAGRGPLAGPVVAAAVILPEDFRLIGLTDSKQLNEEERNKYAQIIKEEAVSYNIAVVSHTDIDRYNIYEATKIAMTQSLTYLSVTPDCALIDAVQLSGLPFITDSIIK